MKFKILPVLALLAGCVYIPLSAGNDDSSPNTGTTTNNGYLSGVAATNGSWNYSGSLSGSLYRGGMTVQTLAGGAAGYADGTGTAVGLNDPRAITADSAGNFYLVDFGVGRVRMVTPNGVVSTIAGSGNNGTSDGIGTAAEFSNPSGICFRNNSLYLTDSSAGNIRKIDLATKQVSTFTHIDGASLGNIAPDSQGNFFVINGNSIMKVTADGASYSVFAGDPATSSYKDGTGTAAGFFMPMGLAFDAQDNIYVADLNNSAVRKITPAGVVTTFAGGNQGNEILDGPALSSRILCPIGIVILPSGDILVTDNESLRLISHGNVTTVAGAPLGAPIAGHQSFNDGTGASASLANPCYMAVAPDGKVEFLDWNFPRMYLRLAY